MTEWKTIDSAPKDGTEILIFFYGKVALGFWLDIPNPAFRDLSISLEDWLEAKRNQGVYPRWGYADARHGHQYCEPEPTHWAHLPEPPSSQGSAK